MDPESISEGNKYLLGATEENDQCEYTPSSEALQKDSCSHVSLENLNKDSCIPVRLLYRASQAYAAIQRGNESVPPETESLELPKAMNECEKSLSGGKEDNNQCDDLPASETLSKDICIPVSPVMALGPTIHANGPIQAGNKSGPAENEPLQSTKKMDVIANTEIIDSIEAKESLSGTKKECVKCYDTASSETLTRESCSPASPVMLLDLTTQTNSSIKAEKESVSPVTESLQSPNMRNIKYAETTYIIDVKVSLLRAKEENDQCEDAPSSRTLNKDRCSPVMLVGPATQMHDPFQTEKRRISPETESLQSPKKMNIPTEDEITDMNKSNESLSGAKEENDDNIPLSGTLDKDTCNLVSPIMVLGQTTQGNDPIQKGKRRVPPEGDSLQPHEKINVTMGAETSDINEVKESLQYAKEENGQCDSTPSPGTINKDSCNYLNPFMLLDPVTEAKCSIQGGNEGVPPKTESLQSPKTINITSDAESTYNKEVKESLSCGRNESDQYDEATSSFTLDSCITVSSVMLLGLTTQANGSIQAENEIVPQETEPLHSPKKINVTADAETTGSIEVKESLSGTKKGNVKYYDTPSSANLNKDRCNCVSPDNPLGPTTQANGSIYTGIRSATTETESMQSPQTMNVNTDAETTDSNDVNESLSGKNEENDQCGEKSSSETLNKGSCMSFSSAMQLGQTLERNDPIQALKGRVPPETESMQSPKTMNRNNDAESMHSNEGNTFLSGGKETYDRCGYMSPFESCNHIRSAMLLGPPTLANGSIQSWKGSVPPETEPLQSTHIINITTDTEATDGNEADEALSHAKEEYVQNDNKYSSETNVKDSCYPDYPVMLLEMSAEANDSIQSGNKSMPPKTLPLRLPKTMNVTTDSETTNNNEKSEFLSEAKDDEQYDDTHSSENLSKETCSSFCPVLPRDPTTQTNGSIQTGKRRVPPETASLQSPKEMNLSTDDKTTDINQLNQSLSRAKEDINQCDDSHFSGTPNKESCNLVSHVMVFGQVQANGTIQREKRRVPPETGSLQSPKKMNIGMDAETTDSNKVNKFLSGNDTIKGKGYEKRIPENAMQQSQKDNATSEWYLMDSGNLGTLEEQDHACGFPRKEDLKPVHIDVQKDGTYTTETKISSSALERVSTEMTFHSSEIGALDEQICATIYGQCIGDAIGLLTEFMSEDSAHRYYGQKTELEYKDKIGDRHRKRWEVGDWTDDSDQMILIMQSLIKKKGVVNPKDFAWRLVKWMEEGFHELGDKGGLGIGHTTYITITKEGFQANPHKISEEVWEDSRRFVAPNGGVMRTSILGIHAWWDTDQVYRNTIDICKTTHYDPRCQASAVAVCVAISLMLQRGDRHYKNGKYVIPTIIEDVFHKASTCLEKEAKEELWEYLQCEDLHKLKLDEANSIGYTYKCLGAGFWALKQTDFRKALQEITMSGGDADTNGAVAGALLGCKLGSRKYFPESWLKLRHRDWLDRLIHKYIKVLKKQRDEWNSVNKERSQVQKPYQRETSV